MEFVVTLAIFAVCMAVMAIGLFFKRKPLTKDCGLDPFTGERVTDCACANQGKPKCFKRRVLTLFGSDVEDRPTDSKEGRKVVPLPSRDA